MSTFKYSKLSHTIQIRQLLNDKVETTLITTKFAHLSKILVHVWLLNSLKIYFFLQFGTLWIQLLCIAKYIYAIAQQSANNYPDQIVIDETTIPISTKNIAASSPAVQTCGKLIPPVQAGGEPLCHMFKGVANLLPSFQTDDILINIRLLVRKCNVVQCIVLESDESSSLVYSLHCVLLSA